MKTNFKKSISFILAVLMLFCALPIASFAASPMEVAFAKVNGKVGEDVAVAVSLKNNPGISSLKLRVSYDESVIALTDVEYNDAFGGRTMKPAEMKSPFTLIWISPFDECDLNETFATLHFSVKKDVCAASSEISATFDSENIYNLENVNVEAVVTPGKLTVVNHKGGTATCLKKAVCEECGKEYGELGAHVEVVDKGTPATCTEAGLSDGKHCSVCNVTLVERKTLAALGHAEVTDKGYGATCTKKGLTDGSHCSRCDKIFTPQTEIPKLNHTSSDWIIDRNTTCELDGSKHKECTVCKTELSKERIPALGHSYGEWKTVEKATCNQTGIATRECSRCRSKENKELAKLSHSDKNNDGICDDCHVNIKEANCKCICHSKNWFVKIIYKIVKFIWKLFKLKPVCACGKRHY